LRAVFFREIQMNEVIDQKNQSAVATGTAALFDTALAVIAAWIEILQAEIRAHCTSARPLSKQIHPLTRKVAEAVTVGRKLRRNDLAAITATIDFYTSLIEAHRQEQSHAA
jgi:ribosomal protein S12 methylthiotransferase accessory factor YcaO